MLGEVGMWKQGFEHALCRPCPCSIKLQKEEEKITECLGIRLPKDEKSYNYFKSDGRV